jgi:hypothetical protein
LGDIGASFDDLVVKAGLQKSSAAERLTPLLLVPHLRELASHPGLLVYKSITATERYSHLGHNARAPYYAELAGAVVEGFVPSTLQRPLQITRKLLKRFGGGAQTRTADLGIMRLSASDCEAMRNTFKDFDFEEDTLP